MRTTPFGIWWTNTKNDALIEFDIDGVDHAPPAKKGSLISQFDTLAEDDGATHDNGPAMPGTDATEMPPIDAEAVGLWSSDESISSAETMVWEEDELTGDEATVMPGSLHPDQDPKK